MGLRGILLQQQVLLGAIILAAIAAAAEPNPSCSTKCGSLQILYPFGTSDGCYLDPSFLITCNDTFEKPTPFLGTGNLEVLNLSFDGELRVSTSIARDCPNEPGYNENNSNSWLSGLDNFPISHKRNKFTAVGCDTLAMINGTVAEKTYATGCLSLCSRFESVVNGSCNGIGCCQTSIPQGMTDSFVLVTSLANYSAVGKFNPCGFSFIVEEKAFNFSSLDLINMQGRETVPVVLDWAVGNDTCKDAQEQNLTSYACKAVQSECYDSPNRRGYLCNCSSGYEGNPYLVDGCNDVNECETSKPCNMICTNNLGSFKCDCPKGYEGDGMKNGTGCHLIVTNSRNLALELGIGISLSLLLLGGFWIYWGLKRRNLNKLKEKLFQQNGGLMLQQQLSNHTGSIEPTKIFSIEELKRATNNYNESRIIGQGGNGTVYKGVLPGNKVVAIKRSKGFDHSQAKQFINE
ncbi:hypothetical protein FH972_019672 [Carpinus fangiana]|uniref:EGF-like domain-containing protein n=1 Tax=Carpinus fangiana TaxID=176857 RepID=A0A5N6RV80_9ROSI|nr:hypothetical protein FH972_019672 [Carpinus fangiana]